MSWYWEEWGVEVRVGNSWVTVGSFREVGVGITVVKTLDWSCFIYGELHLELQLWLGRVDLGAKIRIRGMGGLELVS